MSTMSSSSSSLASICKNYLLKPNVMIIYVLNLVSNKHPFFKNKGASNQRPSRDYRGCSFEGGAHTSFFQIGARSFEEIRYITYNSNYSKSINLKGRF